MKPHTTESSFRVLALDGGGVMGTYTAAVLAEVERMSNKRIIDHFDLITGTSTGGIIAVALGMGVPAEKILSLYVDHGRKIFPRPRFGTLGALSRLLRNFIKPKFSQDVLKQVFDSIIGDKRFGDSQVRLVIPSFNADTGKVHLFKTAHRPEYQQDFLLPVSTVALSTSAAPTYYTAYSDVNGACYLDGGIWANCPVMVGILEAVHRLDKPLASVSVLSIGTTETPYYVDRTRRKGGLISWGIKGDAVNLFMQAQASAALGQAALMLGDRLLRISHVTANGRFEMDDSSRITELKNVGHVDARNHAKEICARFFHSSCEPFIPCNSSDKHGKPVAVRTSLVHADEGVLSKSVT